MTAGYAIKARPTRYKGALFRSRHEARWAAFFDYLRWGWDYEPYDLDNWVPDFDLDVWGRHTLAEIKPTIGHVSAVQERIAENAPAGVDIMILDAPRHGGPWKTDFSMVRFGLILADDVPWRGLYIYATEEPDNKIRFGIWKHGEWETPEDFCAAIEGRVPYVNTAAQLLRHWQEAGNAVRWRPQEA